MSKSVNPASQQVNPEPELEPITAVTARGQIATAVRMGDPEREATARRQLAEARIASAIEKSLAVAPPLTPGQVQRLSGLLRKGGQR